MAYISNHLGDLGQGISQTDVLNLVSGAVSTAANVGLQVYAQKEAAKAAKRQEKIDAMLAAQQQPHVIVQPGSGSSNLMIGAIVGGAVLLGLLVFVLTRGKGSSQSGGTGNVSYDSTVTSSSSASAPSPGPRRIKKIKRVSRPKRTR